MNEMPREPMPRSFRPVWIFLSYMVLIIVVVGIVSLIVDRLVH